MTNEAVFAIISGLNGNAGVAQPVEQLICNQQVGGSNPSTSSIAKHLVSASASSYGGIPEWPKGTDCKSAGNAFDGSNPSSPTSKKHHPNGWCFLLCMGLCEDGFEGEACKKTCQRHVFPPTWPVLRRANPSSHTKKNLFCFCDKRGFFIAAFS